MPKKDTKKEEEPKVEEKEEKPKKEKKAAPKKTEKKEKKEKTTKKEKKEKTTKKTEKKKDTKKAKKSDVKKEKKQTKAKTETKKSAPKKSKKSAKAEHTNQTTANIAEAIAAAETEEQKWVSYQKIYNYLYQYCEYKQPQLIKTYITRELERLVAEKLLQQKKRSYKFTKAGEEAIRPSKVPKRKVLREFEVEEEPEEEVKKETFLTQSGRVVTKVVY